MHFNKQLKKPHANTNISCYVHSNKLQFIPVELVLLSEGLTFNEVVQVTQ